MRIVGGRLKGRRLKAPSTDAIRPTTDRAREALFNILEHSHFGALDGARVLDLFAGTGALGLEALSRGASYAHFVETDAQARGLIRGHLEAFGLNGSAKIYRRDATNLGPIGTLSPFDLVFLDPPYGQGLGERAITAALDGGWLAPGALIILEEASSAELNLPDQVSLQDTRSFGNTVLRFLRCP